MNWKSVCIIVAGCWGASVQAEETKPFQVSFGYVSEPMIELTNPTVNYAQGMELAVQLSSGFVHVDPSTWTERTDSESPRDWIPRWHLFLSFVFAT